MTANELTENEAIARQNELHAAEARHWDGWQSATDPCERAAMAGGVALALEQQADNRLALGGDPGEVERFVTWAREQARQMHARTRIDHARHVAVRKGTDLPEVVIDPEAPAERLAELYEDAARNLDTTSA